VIAVIVVEEGVVVVVVVGLLLLEDDEDDRTGYIRKLPERDSILGADVTVAGLLILEVLEMTGFFCN